MDIVSHGLWGGLAFGRKNRSSFWLAFVIGLAPDLFSFGILWSAAILGLARQPDFSHGTPPESSIPQYVHHLYLYPSVHVWFACLPFELVHMSRVRGLTWGLSRFAQDSQQASLFNASNSQA